MDEGVKVHETGPYHCIGYLAHPFQKMDRLPLQMRSC
jgi:hypothetical protein